MKAGFFIIYKRCTKSKHKSVKKSIRHQNTFNWDILHIKMLYATSQKILWTSGSGTTSLAWTYIKYVDTVTVFAKNWNKGHWPLDDLWPHIFWGLMCDSTQGSLCPSPMKIHQSMWIQWLSCKNLKQRSLTPRWPLTPHLLRSHVWLYPRIIVSKSYENTLKYVDTVTLFAKTWTKGQGHWPLDDLWPHICWGLMCDSTQGSLCPSPMKIHQSMWIQWPFLQKKNLNQRSLTPRWPLTPHLLRSHVWLYPRIILSKSHENTSKYVDTVNLFAKTWTKGHWPLDDLWPHICWGHMCDCAQGSLCPSPMGIHQCMWIQLSILQKLPHTYIHILRTYYVHTTYYILRTESVITQFCKNYHIHTYTYYVHTTYILHTTYYILRTESVIT